MCCGRKKDMLNKYCVRRVGTSHQACSNAVAPADKRFYRIWQALRSRTTTVKSKDYEGISSEYYKYFIDFYDDMWELYCEHVSLYGESDTSIDRIDPFGNYEKENIRWATNKVQNANKRRKVTCKGIDIDGNEYIFTNQVEFAKLNSLNKCRINDCLKGRAKSHRKWKFEYVDYIE